MRYGYTGQSLSWTATDLNPGSYTIELEGTGIVFTSTAWESGVAITYDIPEGLAVGEYVYTVKFKDNEGNFVTDSVTFIVEHTTQNQIGSFPLVSVIISSLIGIIGAGIVVFIRLKRRTGV